MRLARSGPTRVLGLSTAMKACFGLRLLLRFPSMHFQPRLLWVFARLSHWHRSLTSLVVCGLRDWKPLRSGEAPVLSQDRPTKACSKAGLRQDGEAIFRWVLQVLAVVHLLLMTTRRMRAQPASRVQRRSPQRLQLHLQRLYHPWECLPTTRLRRFGPVHIHRSHLVVMVAGLTPPG